MRTILVTCAAIGLAGSCGAQSIVTYNFPQTWYSGNPFPATTPVNEDEDQPALSASPLTLVGLVGTEHNGFISTNWGPSISSTQYISFSVTAGAGFILNLNSISFGVGSSVSVGVDTWVLRYRTTGAWVNIWSATDAAGIIQNVNGLDLSTIGSVRGTVEFGLFGAAAPHCVTPGGRVCQHARWRQKHRDYRHTDTSPHDCTKWHERARELAGFGDWLPAGSHG